MTFLKIGLYSTMLMIASNVYSPSPLDYQRIPPSKISGTVRWETRDEIPGHGFSVSHISGNYFFYSRGNDAKVLRDLVEARSSITVEFESKSKLFDHLIPITIENIVKINGKELK